MVHPGHTPSRQLRPGRRGRTPAPGVRLPRTIIQFKNVQLQFLAYKNIYLPVCESFTGPASPSGFSTVDLPASKIASCANEQFGL
jgi:hypothetical protein